MIYIYLFETKSIQAYLNRTGKLKDLISISDKLDNFIDNSDDCVLSNVLKTADPENRIKFIRRNGGSFYSFSEDRDILVSFRQLWLLTFYQYFPYMAHTDYFGEISIRNFSEDLAEAFRKLNASINNVDVPLPYGTTVIESATETGNPAVEYISGSPVDLASFRLSRSGGSNRSIYEKFIADKTVVDAFICKFNRLHSGSKSSNNDIAYMHFDGNGIGQLIMKIRDGQKDLNKYKDVMTKFSDSLTRSTQEAAKFAFEKVYEKAGRKVFNFRPLVLGGDDLTVMIEPKYAFDYCVSYTKKFEELTNEYFFRQPDFTQVMKELNIQKLTASGGILFNKIKHPASNTGSIVEGLAGMAKDLTKNKHENEQLDKYRGMAAVAFYRMSTSSQEVFDDIMSRGRIFDCANAPVGRISLGGGVYFIDDVPNYPNLTNFMKFLDKVQKNRLSAGYKSIIPVFRRMMTALSTRNFYEAQSIYDRMLSRLSMDEKEEIIKFFTLADPKTEFKNNRFYFSKDDSSESPLADLLVVYHYLYEDGFNDGDNGGDGIEQN